MLMKQFFPNSQKMMFVATFYRVHGSIISNRPICPQNRRKKFHAGLLSEGDSTKECACHTFDDTELQ